MTEITIEQIIEDLLASQESVNGVVTGYSVRQISLRSGLTEDSIRRRLRTLRDCGRLVCSRGPEISIDGKRVLVPYYRILPVAGDVG